MKRSTKISSTIITFFLIIAIVIIGRTMIGNHFKKKFSKRPPPGIIVKEVVYKSFSENIESFGTAVSKKAESFRIKRDNLISELTLKEFVKKALYKEEFKEFKIPEKIFFAPINYETGIYEDFTNSKSIIEAFKLKDINKIKNNDLISNYSYDNVIKFRQFY